jgi:hypothetical protein
VLPTSSGQLNLVQANVKFVGGNLSIYIKVARIFNKARLAHAQDEGRILLRTLLCKDGARPAILPISLNTLSSNPRKPPIKVVNCVVLCIVCV